jgi:hypothetical protein
MGTMAIVLQNDSRCPRCRADYGHSPTCTLWLDAIKRMEEDVHRALIQQYHQRVETCLRGFLDAGLRPAIVVEPPFATMRVVDESTLPPPLVIPMTPDELDDADILRLRPDEQAYKVLSAGALAARERLDSILSRLGFYRGEHRQRHREWIPALKEERDRQNGLYERSAWNAAEIRRAADDLEAGCLKRALDQSRGEG